MRTRSLIEMTKAATYFDHTGPIRSDQMMRSGQNRDQIEQAIRPSSIEFRTKPTKAWSERWIRKFDQEKRSVQKEIMIRKVDQQMWSRNSINNFDQEIWSRNLIKKVDQAFRSRFLIRVEFWSNLDPTLINFWPIFDRISVEIWSNFRRNFDEIGSNLGPRGTQNRPEVGPGTLLGSPRAPK